MITEPGESTVRSGTQRGVARRGLCAVAAGLLSAAAIGVPTDVIDNPWFSRMTPVHWWDYLLLAATAGVTALWFALPGGASSGACRVSGGSLLSTLAVGCPVCNKLVVASLGASGALTVWAPLQPALGVAAVAAVGTAVLAKWRTTRTRSQPDLASAVDPSAAQPAPWAAS